MFEIAEEDLEVLSEEQIEKIRKMERDNCASMIEMMAYANHTGKSLAEVCGIDQRSLCESYNEAKKCYDNGLYEEACNLFRSLMMLDPR